MTTKSSLITGELYKVVFEKKNSVVLWDLFCIKCLTRIPPKDIVMFLMYKTINYNFPVVLYKNMIGIISPKCNMLRIDE